MTANPQTCPKCGSPVQAGMKFCESCGAKIEALPVCAKCGAALAPDVKFCETCGALVSPAAPPAVPVPAAAVPAAPPGAKVAEAPPASAAKSPAEPPAKIEEKPAPAAVEKPAPAPVKETPKTDTVKNMPKEHGPKKPMSRQTMIIAGVIVLALLGAAVYFVVLPMLSGSGTPSPAQPASPAPTTSGSSSGTPADTAGSSPAGTFSLTPGPTQVPPSNRVVIIDAERDPISSLITVTFKGGAGQYGVKEIAVTLTRSDGGVETKTFKPDTIGSGVTLQGTAKTDRVEATTYFYTGEQYKVMDQIFEYKKRGG